MTRLLALWLCVTSLFGLLFCGRSQVRITVDTGTLGSTVGNKVSNVNVWDMGTQFYAPQRQTENDVFAFVEYVQLMQCSGGTSARDLFRDPSDRTVTDDYDFTPLLRSCAGILSLGAKPLLKLGGVPLKYCAEPLIGDFGMNVRPPDDFDVYYRYIRALAQALVDRFGLTEVRTWRFGVMTEYENDEWFYAGDKDPDASCEAYCKLYDYTVQALIDVIGSDVFVGAHAMAVTPGLWDEEAFIRHVAVGKNNATGETGTRICYLSASFYDSRPGRFTTGKTLENTIGDLRKTALQYGLTDLIYGVDEGRIIGASSGADSDALLSRAVGQTWQAAYDARMWVKTIRSDIDYFSSWGYLSDGLWGYPTVSYHVADCLHRMADDQSAAATSTTAPLKALCGIEVDGAASYCARTHTAHVLVYNFRNRLQYSRQADVQLQMHLPQFAGKTVSLRTYSIDDSCNFFDEWERDRVLYGIDDSQFSWSPDDPRLDSPLTLHDPAARQLYTQTLRDRYAACARLTPATETAEVDGDGNVCLQYTLPASGVLFLELTEHASDG